MKNNNENRIIILAPNNISDIYIEALKFSFNVENIILVSDERDNEYRDNLINEINNDKNISKVIFFDYCYIYHQLIQRISNKKDKFIIIKNAISEMNSSYIYNYIKYYLEYLDRGIIKKIAFLDPNFYLEKNDKLIGLKLDIPVEQQTQEYKNNFGIISYDFYEYHNFFNQASAIEKITDDSINIFSPCNITKTFFNDFEIKYNSYDTLEEIINNSKVILYINFCYTDILYLLRCIDKNKVCFMGNFNYNEKYELLNNLLVISSDDDINEIAQKTSITNDKKKLAQILKLQKEFRQEYSDLSKKEIVRFLQV